MTTSSASTTPCAAAPHGPAARRPRVLLALGAAVAPEACEAARVALEAAGLPVTVARDTDAVLESGLQDPPDALLIDPGLPAADVVPMLRFAGFRGPVLAWDARPLDVGALLDGPLAGAAAIDDADGFDALPEFAGMQAGFDEVLPATLARLRSLAQGRAWDELARELHRLKGLAGTFGRADLTRDAQRAGALLAQGRVDAACALCAAMAASDGDAGRGDVR